MSEISINIQKLLEKNQIEDLETAINRRKS